MTQAESRIGSQDSGDPGKHSTHSITAECFRRDFAIQADFGFPYVPWFPFMPFGYVCGIAKPCPLCPHT